MDKPEAQEPETTEVAEDVTAVETVIVTETVAEPAIAPEPVVVAPIEDLPSPDGKWRGLDAGQQVALAIGIICFIILSVVGILSINLLWDRASIFAGIEGIALICAGALSTYNYYKTYVLLSAASLHNTGQFLIFGIINIILFLAATSLVVFTEASLLIIFLIYFFFSWFGILQIRRLTVTPQYTSNYFIAAIFQSIWLGEENGLSAFVFAVILSLLLIIGLFQVGFATENFHYQIKAFAGGAATVHIVLSVLKYTYVVSKEDVVEETIKTLSTDNHLANADTKVDALYTMFQSAAEKWNKRLNYALALSLVCAIAGGLLHAEISSKQDSERTQRTENKTNQNNSPPSNSTISNSNISNGK